MKKIEVVIINNTQSKDVVFETIYQYLLEDPKIKIVGFLSNRLPIENSIMGIQVLGNFNSWSFLPQSICFFPIVHNVKSMPAMVEEIFSLGIPQERWLTIVHSKAIVADSVTPGYGSFIGPYVVIQPAVQLGTFLFINTGVNISHDCQVKDFVFIGSKSCLSGRSIIDTGVHLSCNVAVANDVQIGAYSVVSSNTAVCKSVSAYSFVMGNPGVVQDYTGTK